VLHICKDKTIIRALLKMYISVHSGERLFWNNYGDIASVSIADGKDKRPVVHTAGRCAPTIFDQNVYYYQTVDTSW